MINKQSFSQVAKRIRRTGQGLHDPQLMHPDREWGVGLLVTVLIFAVSAVWSAQTYLKYRSASINVVEPVTENVQIYRASMIDAALENFSTREAAKGSFMEKVVKEEVTTESGEEGEQATTTAKSVVEEGEADAATTSEEVVEE